MSYQYSDLLQQFKIEQMLELGSGSSYKRQQGQKPLKPKARIRASFRSHDFEARWSGEASRHPGGCHQQRAAHQAPKHQPVGQGRWTLSTWSCATTTASRSADGLPASESGGSSPASATTAAWTQIRLQQLRISATSARFTLAKLFWYLSPIV